MKTFSGIDVSLFIEQAYDRFVFDGSSLIPTT